MPPSDGIADALSGESGESEDPPLEPEHRRRFAPALWLGIALVLIALLLALLVGPVAAGQATLNGFVGAGYFALGAVGLTLIYGVIRLVNFAHGDMLTLGMYLTLAATALGVPFWPAAAAAMLASAVIAVILDRVIWAPMRRARTSTLQLFLVATGLALVLRYGVQFFAGSQVRAVGLDTTSAIDLGPWHLGRLQLAVMLVGLATIVLTGLGLRHTRLGKEMRAVADNAALAEVTGIDTQRTIRATWLISGALAALAGILYAASIGSINPNFGFTILLSLFAAAVLGGTGNAYGALAGGIVIGLSQEWATLFLNPRWKPAVGFAILVLTLLLMPRGIFGRKRVRP
ncbi:MAG: branched-chain amino acid ABC transporter permease [Alphaproteobacteria bacterium]|nr:branched-chain amino acid ABC transporter permease [Alphaproteobacteria bacterium]